MPETIVLLVLSYLIGSIQTAYLVGRLYGKDIRKIGSKNVGAANVFRSIGKWQGILVAIVDIVKGLIVLYIAMDNSLLIIYLAGLVAVAGHNWPFYLGFRGGQGVATSAGLVIGSLFLPGLGKMIALAFILNFIIMRYMLVLPFRK